MTEKAKHPVQTTEKSLRLIETLKEEGSTGITELAQKLEMGPSGVHNHLNTLKQYGYVVQEGEEYRVGLKFLEVGGYIRNRMILYQAAKPEIHNLAEESGELVNLMIPEMNKGVYLYREHGSQALGFDTYAGQRKYLHSTALGKAILAHYPDSRVEEVINDHGLPPQTENTITDRETLYDELKSIKKEGIAIDDEEESEGVKCIAVAIKPDTNKEIMGALSISAPLNRIKGQRAEDELAENLERSANVIELQIKYNRPG